MHVSMAVDANSGSPQTIIPTSNPTQTQASNLTPLPTTHTPTLPPSTQTQIQLSPGQKRSAHEADVSTTTPLSSSRSDSNPPAVSTYGDDKENRDASMAVKGVEYSSTVSAAIPDSAPAHTAAGILGPPVPNIGIGQAPTQAGNNGAGSAPTAKRRKLSPASREAKQQEKEAKQQEREAKERHRLEEKAKREEEKARREEERVKKEEERKKREAEREEERKKREEKKKAKEEEKAAKDEEKRKREEEKLKKERAQPKLSSFFTKPKTPAAQTPARVSTSPKKPSSDATSVDGPGTGDDVSDYKRLFQDFFLHGHTHLAPPHRFERDAEALAHVREKVDSYLKCHGSESAEPLGFRPSELFRMIPYKRRGGCLDMSVREILLQMQSLHDAPETSEAARKLQNSLKQVRMKTLKFGEDVRPPYMGTYTKNLPRSAALRMMRNPFRRGLPEVNYDYDSEAEWEDAEEGEELDSEEEEEGSEDGDDDMDGFLDDEDDHLLNGKRRLLVGDLEPVCTGIRWQDQGSDLELQAYKIETILPSVTFPIDPFSSSYWQKPQAPGPAQPNVLGRSTLHSFMGNPASHTSVPLTIHDGNTVAAGKPKRAFPVEQLGEFKTVVEGSDLTKTGLIEVLKKRFPKVSKDTLKTTLDSVATRVGQKEADKKWVCR